MSFATPPSYDFGDGVDAGSSTELGNVKLVGTDVSITGLGAATAVVFDGAKLAARIAEAKPLAASTPTRGFVLDVQDDPAAAIETKTLSYIEATTAPAPARYDLRDAGVTKAMLPATLDGLELALGLLGF